jgi:beta-lactamase class A
MRLGTGSPIRSANASTYLHVRFVIDSGFILSAATAAGVSAPSVILEPLEGTPGPQASLDPDAGLYPASMIKVPIAAALASAYDEGRHAPTDRVRVEAGNVTTNDAESPFVLAYEATLDEAARAMLSASDNVATNLLIDVLGRAWIGAVCRETFGLTATAVRRKLSGSLPLIDDPEATGRNAHPAADAAKLFSAIARERNGRFGWIYDALAAQVWNDKVPAGLRPGDRFAHKTGDTDEVSHDGGILTVDDGRAYVLVVYSSLPSTPESDARIASFTRTLRDALG